jgi:hypothetical protein
MKKENKMKRLNITLGTILLVFGCFAFAPSVKADQAIVGLWVEHYTGLGPAYDTYAQWHSDGLEIESPSFSLGQCQGIFKQAGARTFQLFHVGWLPGGGPNGSIRFELRELNTVSVDKNSFDGSYDQKFFDADGNVVFEDMGTLHGTRLSVDQFSNQPNATAIK